MTRRNRFAKAVPAPDIRTFKYRCCWNSPFTEILGSAVTRPHIPLYPRVSKQLQTMLEAVLTGRLDPVAAARLTAGLIEAITGLPIVREPAAVPVVT